MRVYELAKELGVPTKDLLAKIRAMGIEISTHMAPIDDADAAKVRKEVASGGVPAGAGKAKAGKPKAGAKSAAKGKTTKAKAGAKSAAKAKTTKAKAGAKSAAKAKKAAKPAKTEEAVEEVVEETSGQISLEGFAPAPGGDELPSPTDDEELADQDEDALHERVVADAGEAARELSPEEQELAALYGEELAPAAPLREFADQRTADEDRPMLPEINAREERQKRWEQRRDERRARREADKARRQEERQRRGERPAGEGGGRDRDRDRGPGRELRELPAGELRPAAAATPDGEAEHVVQRVGNTLGDAAWQVFASLKNSQPLPVRQLAQMMRKRGLLAADPEQAWPHLKAALLGDERSYRGLGLRPRIVYRGRDLFAPGPVAMSATASAEAGVATALSSLAVATHHALKERIARASLAGFERLIHAYLVSVGYRDIEWIKRVDGISYATALPPDGSSAILVSARSGDAPVDRRGVGELRVGVEAKGLLSGLLVAARELSPEAERELERPGRSISVLCGDALVSALLSSGVGVVTVAAPLRYVDDQMLDELLAG